MRAASGSRWARAGVVALAAALFGTGCQKGLECGEGTRLEGSRCVPQSLAHCGEGTHLDGEACLPDSTLQCGAGTHDQDGSCVPDRALTCGAGTEERNGRCVVVDPLRRVTVPEAVEPNVPPGKPARFVVPAVGAAPAVLGGVIGPLVQGQPDFDAFVFKGERNQRLQVKGTAVGAPSVGLSLQPCLKGSNPCQLEAEASFTRFALTLTARGAGRELVLPWTGDWLLVVTDQSNLTQGLPMGSSDFSYTVDVTQLEARAPRPLTVGQTASGLVQSIDQYSWSVSADQPLFDLTLAQATDGFSGLRAVWATSADGTMLLHVQDEVTFGFLQPIAPQRLAPPSGTHTVTVDYQYAVGDPAPYQLTLSAVPHAALGALPQPASRAATIGGDGTAVFTVDLAANSLLQAEVQLPAGSALQPQIELRDQRFQLLQSVKGSKLSWFTAALQEGRFFLVVSDRSFAAGKPAMPFTLAASSAQVQPVGPVAVATGAVQEAGSVGADGSAWFAVYAGNDARLSLSAHPTDGSDVALAAWPVHLRQPIAESRTAGAGASETVSGLLTPSGGVLLAQVTGAAGAQFTLEARAAETVAIFEAEPNDDTGHANPLVLDGRGHAEAAGELPTTSDSDYFMVTLPSAGQLVVETGAGIQGGKADTRLTIYNQQGSALLSNDDAPGTRFSRLQLQVQPGTYFLRVQRWSAFAPYDGNDYSLVLDHTAVP